MIFLFLYFDPSFRRKDFFEVYKYLLSLENEEEILEFYDLLRSYDFGFEDVNKFTRKKLCVDFFGEEYKKKVLEGFKEIYCSFYNYFGILVSEMFGKQFEIFEFLSVRGYEF